MAAHRYWRANAFEAYAGGRVELSAFELMDGTTRMDAAATLTSNIAPTSGSLANLKDDDSSTSAWWTLPAGLVLNWDFGLGGDVSIMDIRLGATDVLAYFPLVVRLQWSDDNVNWTTLDTFAGISWPGARTKTSSRYMPCVLWSERFRTSNTTLDSTRKTLTISASVKGAQGELGVVSGTGKHQFSVLITAALNSIVVGVGNRRVPPEQYPGATFGGWGYYNSTTAQKANQGTLTAYGANFTTGDVIDTVYEDGSLTFYKNGASQGVSATGITGEVFPWVGTTGGGTVSAELQSTLLYPVAGAVPWGNPAPYRIQTNEVQGRTALDTGIAIPTSAQVAVYGNTTAMQPPAKGRNDYQNVALGQGIGKVFGTTKIDGTPTDAPVSTRVRLFRDHDGLLIREAWSHPTTGAYEFLWLDELHTYTVVAYDHTENYRAVVADRITPDLIT